MRSVKYHEVSITTFICRLDIPHPAVIAKVAYAGEAAGDWTVADPGY